eukprot:m.287721 g.287721  ORF g.287721 m.287721 type:complete len:108 (-) comp16365_c1_seq4:1158-1481(-)
MAAKQPNVTEQAKHEAMAMRVCMAITDAAQVTPRMLQNAGHLIQKRHYGYIVEEFVAKKLCGWSLCKKPLRQYESRFYWILFSKAISALTCNFKVQAGQEEWRNYRY